MVDRFVWCLSSFRLSSFLMPRGPLCWRDVEASGFEKISWEPLAADGAPPDPEESYMEIVGVFTARLA